MRACKKKLKKKVIGGSSDEDQQCYPEHCLDAFLRTTVMNNATLTSVSVSQKEQNNF